MKVLLIVDDVIKGDVFSLAIEGYFDGARVILAEKAVDATSMLCEDKTFTCVVFQYNASKKSEYSELIQTLSSTQPPPSLIVLPDGQEPISEENKYDQTFILKSPLSIKDLVMQMEECCTVGAQLNNRFSKVALATLQKSGHKHKLDLFIKISDEKYLKVINKEDGLNAADFQKFQEKKITALYTRKEDFLGLMDGWLKELDALSQAKGDSVPLSTFTNIFSNIHETVHEAIIAEGFTPELQKLAEASVNMAVNTIKNNPKLSKLFEQFKTQSVPYISSHSTALGFIACKLATLMDWHSEATFYKLSLAAYLHDITIQKDEWAKYQTKEEINASGLSEALMKEVLTHPKDASTLLAGIKEVPGEVAFIIEQHHERPDGKGFPRGILHKEMSPISSLFIIAHDIVFIMQANPENFDFKKFLEHPESEKKYSRGSLATVFRKIKEKSDSF